MSVNSPRTRALAELPTGTEVASYSKYDDAAAAVEYLGESGFPLGAVTIAGSDLHMIEKIMGKLTPARVAISGGSQGLTWGLLMGLISIIALPQAGPYVALVAISMGVLAGVLINVGVWAASSKKRKFYGQSGLVASRYAILVSEQADRAFGLLSGTEGNTPPRMQRPSRLTQSAPAKDRPRTYSEAQGKPETGPAEKPRRRASSEPPRYGVRKDEAGPEDTKDQGGSAS